MTLDTKALDNATATFERSWYALSEMESAGLPAELDQDARNIARIIQEHGPDYADTEHGDMTAPLLESLARLVQAAKAADRLAALEGQLHLANIDALQAEAERNELASELRQAMDERDAVLANLDAPDDMDVISAAHFVAGSLSTAEEALEAAQAEVRELRAELARVKTLSATWREQAQALAEQQEAECDPDIASVLEATGDQLETCAEELDAALSPAPEPILSTCPVCGDPDDHEHDSMAAPAPELPLMARDTCTNCGGTGVGGYHVHAPQEDAVEALRCEACDGFGYTPAAQESGDASD